MMPHVNHPNVASACGGITARAEGINRDKPGSDSHKNRTKL